MRYKYIKSRQFLQISKIPEEIKKFYADNVDAHKYLSYEERAEQ